MLATGLRAEPALVSTNAFAGWVILPSQYSNLIENVDAMDVVFIMPATNVYLTAQLIFGGGGDGSSDHPFEITTKEHLLSLANTPSLYDKNYILKNDIDLGGEVFRQAVLAPCLCYTKSDSWWYSAKVYGYPFSGVFDGNGHKIFNFIINGEKGESVGLFGVVGVGAKIKNLYVEGDILTEEGDAGGISAYNFGTILQCRFRGSIVVDFGSSMAGGLCGINYGSIMRCSVEGSVSGGWCGGFCALNLVPDGDAQFWIDGQFSSIAYDFNGEIVECSSFCDVVSLVPAGFCLVGDGGAIVNCFSVGRLLSLSGNLGAFCFACEPMPDNCFWDIEVSGALTSYGGVGLTTAEMQTKSTFTDAGWDFVNAWYMDGYPALRCFIQPGTYDYWLMDAELPADLREHGATPALDGIPNLLKYACGLPATNVCGTADLMTVVPGDSNMFSVLYYKSRMVEDVTLQPIWSDELSGTWSTLGIVHEMVGQDVDREQWKASIPLNARGFIRLRATVK